MPDKTKLFDLLRRLFAKEALTDTELKALYQSLNRQDQLPGLNDEIDKIWLDNDFDQNQKPDSNKVLRNIQVQISPKRNLRSTTGIRFYKWGFAAAASILLVVMLTVPMFFELKQKNDDASLLTEITAPNGQIKEVELPDGTKIWLNPGSSVTYPLDLAKRNIRNVRLSGQAFFQVAKNAKHPFILEMGDIGLKVLGTSFNVSNYKEDPTIAIALKEGKIILFEGTYENAVQFTELTPGQLARYTKGRPGFSIEKTDVSRLTSWLNGELIFRDEPMENVFRQLERWYNVRILVDDPAINNYLFTATIKTENLDKILDLIEFTSKLDCKYIDNNGFQAYKPTILIKNKMK